MQGKALSVEDMADVLSLKDNKNHVEDYATALQLLARAEVYRSIFHHSPTKLISIAYSERTKAQRVQDRLETNLEA